HTSRPPYSLFDKAPSHRAFNVGFRFPAAFLSMRPLASLDRSARGGLAPHVAGRYSDLSCSIGLGRGVLYLRSTRAASTDMDAGDPFSAMSACLGNWSVTE